MDSERQASVRLKALIKRRGLTYQQIGDEIGITKSAVASVVAGITTGATARYAVAAVLGVQVEDIWGNNSPLDTAA